MSEAEASWQALDPEGIGLYEAIKAQAPPMSAADEAELTAMMARVRKPLGPGEPRRHHFIPQFFQKRFANEDERLVVINLERQASAPRHVRHIAQMKDLYRSVDEEFGDTVSTERMLAEVDGQASSAIARLAHGVLFPPQPKDRGILALWFALLLGRDPFSRRQLAAMTDHTYRIELAINRNPDVARVRLRERLGREPTQQEVDDIVDVAEHVEEFEVMPEQTTLIKQFLDGALAMAPHLMRRRFAVLKFEEPGLALCDRPMVLRSNHSDAGGVGVINADEIWLPMDRTTGLVLHYDPDVGNTVGPPPNGFTTRDFNQVVVWNSASEVYCHPDDVESILSLDFPPEDRPLLLSDGSPFPEIRTDGVNAPPRRLRHRR